MVLEIIKGKEKPPVCIVDLTGPFDFQVTCDITESTVRSVVDKQKVCIIEFDPNTGRPLSYCGPGKDIVARLFKR